LEDASGFEEIRYLGSDDAAEERRDERETASEDSRMA